MVLPTGPVTVSIGVVEVVCGEPIAEAMARADARLYAAKSDGRNQVRS
jgi:PleD family two-component response regulator